MVNLALPTPDAQESPEANENHSSPSDTLIELDLWSRLSGLIPLLLVARLFRNRCGLS